MSIGARFYGLAAIALGLPGLLLGSFVAMGMPVPAQLPFYQLLVWVAGGLLVVAGLVMNRRRSAASCLPASSRWTCWRCRCRPRSATL